MKRAILFLLTMTIAATSFCQSELRRMVPFDIPIGTSEANAKSIISRHNDISMRSSETKNGVKIIEYRDTWLEKHVLYLIIEKGYVREVEWGYQYSYSSDNALSEYNAIKTYLEETYGKPDHIEENGSGLMYSYRDYSRYYAYYKDENYGAILQYCDARSNSSLLSLFMLAFSDTDGGSVVSIRFCSTTKVRQAINKIKQKEKERAEQQKTNEFNTMINRAREYANNGEYEEALKKYQEALSFWPEKTNEYEAEMGKCKQDWAAAEEIKKQKKFNDLISEARNNYQTKYYADALTKYNAAFAIYPEKEKDYTTEVDECRSRFNCRLGDIELDRHQYSKAREYYNAALQLTSEFEEEIENKLSLVDEVERLDNERKTTTYTYHTINNANYIYATNRLEELILEYAKKNDLKPCTVTVSYSHSISGYETKEVNVSPENYSLKSHLSTNAPSLPVCEKYGLKLATTATIQIPVESVEMKTFTAKRKYNGIKTDESLRTETSSQMTNPGRYNVVVTTTCINGKYNSFQRLLSYKNTGGPSNALWSVLVPGLGQHKVTYGENSGVWTTVGVYGLIAGGIGFYLYSNSEYDKYHQATTQADMDKHFENAQGLRGFAYATLASAAAWWIYDIVDVYLQGKKNNDKYGNGRAYVSYLPQNNALGICYTLNF